MKKVVFLLFGVLCLFADEQMHQIDLSGDLEEVSKIATKSKLNVSSTPAVVSVLHPNELKKLGITTLYEALGTVPGVELSMGTAGAKQINMRGNKSLIRDKMKLMIDGVAINSELAGSAYFYLDMPLDLIERIEIVRGPASVLYGSLAHIGVINVITKTALHKDAVVAYSQSSAGFKSVSLAENIHQGEMHIALDGYFNKNDKERAYGNYSALLAIQKDFTSFEDYTDKSVGLKLQYDGFSLNSRFLEHETQNYYGYGDWPIVRDPKKIKIRSFFSEAAYSLQPTKEFSVTLKAGVKRYDFGGESRYVPFSIMPTPPYPKYDLIGGGIYQERVLYSEASMLYKHDNNELLFGVYGARSDELHLDYKINNVNSSESLVIPQDNIKPDIHREQYAFYINDIYALDGAVTLDLGVRYDYYSDTDAGFAPKIALMYDYDVKQNFKLLYQRSFRTPSFLELYGSGIPYWGVRSLKSETLDTVEFVYHLQSGFNDWVNCNVYYSKMSDFIDRDPNFYFYNGDDIHSYGAELEIKHTFDATTTLQANYSYVQLKNKDDTEVPLISNHLANLMLFKRFTSSFESGTHVQYLGAKERQNGDIREAIGAKTFVDQTFTYYYDQFTFMASVKDIFNSKLVYPSKLGNSVTTGTYEDDFARDGRTFWFSIAWELP